MTAPAPQPQPYALQEYIITEEQLQLIAMYAKWSQSHMIALEHIRSRPAPSPQPAPIECADCGHNNHRPPEDDFPCFPCRAWVLHHDTAIRNAERNATLDIINKRKDALYQIMPDGHWNQVLQAKFDVLLWVEEQVRKGDHP